MIAALVLAAAVAAGPPPPVERASLEDCAVIVAIGRAELGWNGQRGPDHDFFGEHDRPGGGTYRQACDWTRFGVVAPRLGTPQTQRGFSVLRPKYTGDRASATLDVFVRKRGQNLAPFRVRKTCELARHGRAWVVTACRQSLIT